MTEKCRTEKFFRLLVGSRSHLFHDNKLHVSVLHFSVIAFVLENTTMSEPQQNWARNYTYSAARWHYPKTVEQVQELVMRCRKLKALGTRHSFNSIADTPEDIISLEHFDRVVALDHERRAVTVEAGVRYGQLCRYLHREGYALHNLASLPHISVAGACATATHGSGDGNGNLSTIVSAMEMVTANGEVIVLSLERDGERFHGAVVGLGGLGVVTKLTLDILPAFDMRQNVYENLPLSRLENNFDAILSSTYSVSLFTDWQSDRINQVWLKRRVSDNTPFAPDSNFFGARLATRQIHPIAGHPAEFCTEQMGVVGSWHERLPHFRMDFTPSSGEELQTEYFVPRQHAFAALSAIARLREQVAPLLQISEVRTIAADNLWMSPCYQQACIAIHFTWKKNWEAVRNLLPLIEEQLAPFSARPHWGKLFTMSPARLQALYEKLPDFQNLLRFYDPQGKFRNAFLDTHIFATNRD
jgi:xylitol oxidase